MEQQQDKFSRVCTTVRNLCATIAAVSAVIGTAVMLTWAAYGMPQVDSMIQKKIDPVVHRMSQIEDGLDMIDAQLKAMLTDEEAAKADAIYSRSRKIRGRQ